MRHLRHLIVILVILGACTSLFAQATGDYRSKATGNWNALSTWERYNGSSWAEPTSLQGTPDNTKGVTTVRSPNVVTVTATVSVDQVTIDSGAQVDVNSAVNVTVANGAGTDLTVNGIVKNGGVIIATGTIVFANGSKYQHNWPAGGVGTIPTATWQDGSLCEIINMAGTGSTTKLQGTSQSFYDFTWNCTGQSQSVYIRGDSFRPIRNNFRMTSSGTSNMEVSAVEPTGGPFRLELTNYIQTGGIVTIGRNTTGYTVNIAGNFNMSGGTLNTNLTGGSSTVNFTKAGTQTFTRSAGTMTGAVNYVVKAGSTLDMGTSVIANSSGTFTLESGAGLITANLNGITSSGASGSIQTAGTRNYNTGANYTYNGAAAQVTGSGLPASVNNLTINNSSGVTLTNSVTVNGTLTQTSGSISGTQAVDGYYAPVVNFIEFPETGNNIAGWSISMTTPTLMPQKVNRQWTINGTYTGSKSITFYWTATDDNYYPWLTAGDIPSVYKGTTEYTQTAYNVSGSTRWVTVSIASALTKGVYTIGPANGDPLPVELSSFTAIPTQEYFVHLRWVTQTETSLSGYRIYRGISSALSEATMLNVFIDALNTSEAHSYEFTDTEIEVDGIYYYWLESLDLDGNNGFYGPVQALVIHGENPNDPPVIPIVQGIEKIFPNPFNPETSIGYIVKDAAQVKVAIYDFRGRLVARLYDGDREAGNFRAVWNGRDMNGIPCSSGIYLARVTIGSNVYARRMVMTK